MISFRPRSTKQILLACGGWVDGQTSNTIEIFDYQTNMWLSSNMSLPKTLSYFGLEIVNDVLYVFGGSDSRNHYRHTKALDLRCNLVNVPIFRTLPIWTNRCSMIEFRCYVTSVVLDGKIYALGGYNKHQRVSSCEVYDPESDSWTQIASMNYCRSDAGAVAHNGRIYIAGGINDTCIERSIEVYDPVQNSWTLLKSMVTPRTSFSFASFQGKFWALGGNDGLTR